MNEFSPLGLQFFTPILSSIFEKEILGSIVGAVLGALLAFLFSLLLQRQADRKNRALELIQEYSSPEFIDIRNDAGMAIREEFAAMEEGSFPSWNELFQKYGDSDDGSQWRKISKIKHFYEKLNFLVELKEANLQYVSSYFYEEFHHWNDKYFLRINGASAIKELDVSALEKYLMNPKGTWFFLGLGFKYRFGFEFGFGK